MPSENQTFKNENFEINLKISDGCIVDVEVTSNPCFVKKLYKDAISSVGKTISLPGFRKGRVREDILLSKFEPNVNQRWQEFILENAFDAVLNLSSIYPLSKKSVRQSLIKNCCMDSGATVSFVYEAAPRLPEINFEGVTSFNKTEKPVTEEDINNEINNLLYLNAEWNEITERTAEANDFIIVSVDSVKNGVHKPFIENKCLQLTDTGPFVGPEWLSELVYGMAADSSKEVILCDEELKNIFGGDSIIVNLLAIKTPNLPEINDELAQKVGANSVDELKEKVLKRLEAIFAEDIKQEQIAHIQKSFSEKHPFDLPESLLSREVKTIFNKLLTNHKLKTKDISQLVDVDISMLEKEARETAINRLCMHFLTDKIFEISNSNISSEELNEATVRFCVDNPSIVAAQGKQKDSMLQEAMFYIHRQLKERKVAEYLISKLISSTSQE